jgi:hypothetical protein
MHLKLSHGMDMENADLFPGKESLYPFEKYDR